MSFKKIFFFCTIIFFISSGFIRLDKGKSHPLLEKLEHFLDLHAIDIIVDWESDVALRGNPVLAPIANYKISVLEKKSEWIDEFTNSYKNALIALETDLKKGEFDFLKEWNASPPEKKVFVSFTKEDVKHAEVIKSALEKEGYKVFIYKESNRATFTNPTFIAQCMREAENVFIIDTDNSRNKPGVMAEALAYAKYRPISTENVISKNYDISEEFNNEMSNKLEKFDYNESKFIQESIEFYKEKYDKIYTPEEAREALYRDYNLILGENSFIKYNIKKEHYVRDTKNVNQASLRTKLEQNLESFKNIKLGGNNKFKNFLSIIDNLSICPYYKIPKSICPRCH